MRWGGLYYWPPGRALCIFYGPSQIYTPGKSAGLALGPLHRLDRLEGGEEAWIQHPPENLLDKELVEVIEARGYMTAGVRVGGEDYQAAGRLVGGQRIHLLLYEEDGYIIAEGDPLFPYDESPQAWAVTRWLRRLVDDKASLVRVDLDEEGNVALTGVFAGERLGEFLEEYERVWKLILAELGPRAWGTP